MTTLPAIAAVLYESGKEYDLLLARVAERAAARGLRLAGVVQVNETYDALCACDMTLRDLGTGTEIGISQRLGKHARGCRLDPSALERAVVLVASGLEAGCDLLVLNKFGKMEASGRGFRALIGDALAAVLPDLLGITAANGAAWREFAGEHGVVLPADEAAILDWITALSPSLRRSA